MPQRFKVCDGSYPHFITIAVTYWIPIFVYDRYFRVLVDSLIYCIEHKGLIIHGYVLMPNHFHLICSHADGRVSDVIRDLKGFTSRRIAQMLMDDGRNTWLRAMKGAGGGKVDIKVWQDEFHPEQVHKEEFFIQKLSYMHNNPVRAGFVEDPCTWKYSSAAFCYDDKPSIIPITPIEW